MSLGKNSPCGTLDKAQTRCLDSLKSQMSDVDDFWGDSLDARWNTAVGGGATVATLDNAAGGVLRLTSGAGADTIDMNWNDIRCLFTANRVITEWRLKVTNIANLNLSFGLYNGNNNYFLFLTNAGWSIQSRAGGVGAAALSGVTIDTDWHLFRIEAHTHGSNHAHFLIDGIETDNSPITTNIPVVALMPRIYFVSETVGVRQCDIDYISWCQTR